MIVAVKNEIDAVSFQQCQQCIGVGQALVTTVMLSAQRVMDQ